MQDDFEIAPPLFSLTKHPSSWCTADDAGNDKNVIVTSLAVNHEFSNKHTCQSKGFAVIYHHHMNIADLSSIIKW